MVEVGRTKILMDTILEDTFALRLQLPKSMLIGLPVKSLRDVIARNFFVTKQSRKNKVLILKAN